MKQEKEIKATFLSLVSKLWHRYKGALGESPRISESEKYW